MTRHILTMQTPPRLNMRRPRLFPRTLQARIQCVARIDRFSGCHRARAGQAGGDVGRFGAGVGGADIGGLIAWVSLRALASVKCGSSSVGGPQWF